MTFTSSSIIKKLLLLFLVIAGLYLAKPILMPIAVATVLATFFLPFCKWIESKHVPRGLAASLCLFILLIVIALIVLLVGWQVFELTKNIDLVERKTLDAFSRIQEFIFSNIGISRDRQIQVLKHQQQFIAEIFTIIVSSFAYIVAYFILILFFVVFLLYYRNHIKQYLLKLSSSAQREEMENVIYSVANVSTQYLFGLSKMIVLLWVMYGIGFSILGVKNALFFAFLCGLLELIPFVGNITGTSITVLISAFQGGSPVLLVGIIITYGIVQFIQGWVLEPFIVGPQVKINPLSTIIALLLGDLVWGIPGVFLAIPLIAMFKIVCDHIEPLHPLGFLIGETENGKKKVRIKK